MNLNEFLASSTPLVVCPPDVPPFEAVIRELERKVDSEGWDAPSRVFWLDNLGGSPTRLGVLPAMPTEMGCLHPTAMMAGLAAALLDVPTAVKPSVIGLVLTYEAWGVATPSDPAAKAELDAAIHTRTLNTRADRVEIRQALLITLTGQELVLTRERGGQVFVTDGAHNTGAVVDSLRMLATTVRAILAGR